MVKEYYLKDQVLHPFPLTFVEDEFSVYLLDLQKLDVQIYLVQVI